MGRRRSRYRGRAFAAVAALQKFFSCRGHQYSVELINNKSDFLQCDKKNDWLFIHLYTTKEGEKEIGTLGCANHATSSY